MTRQRTAVDLVVEWSPRGLVAFDAKTKQLASFDTATELAASLGAREALVAPSRRSTFVRSVRVPNATPEEMARRSIVVGGVFRASQAPSTRKAPPSANTTPSPL